MKPREYTIPTANPSRQSQMASNEDKRDCRRKTHSMLEWHELASRHHGLPSPQSQSLAKHATHHSHHLIRENCRESFTSPQLAVVTLRGHGGAVRINMTVAPREESRGGGCTEAGCLSGAGLAFEESVPRPSASWDQAALADGDGDEIRGLDGTRRAAVAAQGTVESVDAGIIARVVDIADGIRARVDEHGVLTRQSLGPRWNPNGCRGGRGLRTRTAAQQSARSQVRDTLVSSRLQVHIEHPWDNGRSGAELDSKSTATVHRFVEVAGTDPRRDS